nr:hypothetical protein [Paraflavitalea speifideiaquila]
MAELERLQKQAVAEPPMPRPITATQQLLAKARAEHKYKSSSAYKVSQEIEELSISIGNLLQGLFEPVHGSQSIDPEFRLIQKKRR